MLKWATLIFVGWMVLRLIKRAHRRELGGGEVITWAMFWLVLLLAAWFPHATDVAAQWFGVGRGADLLIFLSIIALFAFVSSLISRVRKVEHDITTVVRETALRNVAGDAPSTPRTANRAAGRAPTS